MMRATLGVVAVLVAVGVSGCLVKDTVSTVYLEPDGRLQWVVVEQQVRSDAETATEREREESGWLDAVRGDRHPVAEAFRALGGEPVLTTVLRDARPWAVRVEAAFPGLATVFEPALTACAVPHQSHLSTRGAVTTWTFEADTRDASEGPEGCDAPFEGLVDAAEVTILLTEGRFVASQGFRIDDGDRATLADDALDPEKASAGDGMVRLSLSWTTAPARRP